MRSSVSRPTTSTTQIRSVAACSDSPSVTISRRIMSRTPMPAEPAPSMTTFCCDGGRALDVVVEGEQLVAVTAEDRQRVRGGEVFPLQQHAGELLLHCGDEAV